MANEKFKYQLASTRRTIEINHQVSSFKIPHTGSVRLSSRSKSPKFRWTTPSLLIRKLQAFPRQHVLTQALQEYGRLIKTIFILRYFQSEAYRGHIGAQLNKGEKLHALRAHLFSANRGRIRRKYPDDHLNQANCLNLIINAIITWNTVYMQAAIDHLQQQGDVIAEDDLVQLSPVRFEHINIHGKYSFDISVPLLNNGLRSLADGREE